MSTSGLVSVPSAAGQLFFTVTGTNTLAYASRFSDAVNTALSAGTLNYNNLSDPGTPIPGYKDDTASSATLLQEISHRVNGAGQAVPYTLAADTNAGGVYTFVSGSGQITVNGSGTGDNLLVGYAANAEVTYNDVGGSNNIVFDSGNNLYNGDTAGGGGADTITAGSGSDTILTGSGLATVMSGTGNADIVLQDTGAPATGTIANQYVYLDDGLNTVYADGTADIVVATAPGQTIVGGSGADSDTVALVNPEFTAGVNSGPYAGPNPATGSDTVVANNAGSFTVYDATNANAVFGGTGTLTVVFGDSVEGSVVAGTGSNNLWLNASDTIDYFAAATAGTSIISLGTGTESVDASGAQAPLTLVTGTGNETLIGGSNGTNFIANNDTTNSGTGTVTINDYAANSANIFDFVGFTSAEVQQALDSNTTVTGGLQITLSDQTKVTFLGISNINQLHYTS